MAGSLNALIVAVLFLCVIWFPGLYDSSFGTASKVRFFKTSCGETKSYSETNRWQIFENTRSLIPEVSE